MCETGRVQPADKARAGHLNLFTRAQMSRPTSQASMCLTLRKCAMRTTNRAWLAEPRVARTSVMLQSAHAAKSKTMGRHVVITVMLGASRQPTRPVSSNSSDTISRREAPRRTVDALGCDDHRVHTSYSNTRVGGAHAKLASEWVVGARAMRRWKNDARSTGVVLPPRRIGPRARNT